MYAIKFNNDSGDGADLSKLSKSKSSNWEWSCIRPVTIHQILESTDEIFTLYGKPVKLMSVVGITKRIIMTETSILYTVEDSTGFITAAQWLSDSNATTEPPVPENVYCKMFGTKAILEGSVCFVVQNISVITDPAERDYHELEVAYILKFSKPTETSSKT